MHFPREKLLSELQKTLTGDGLFCGIGPWDIRRAIVKIFKG